MLTAFCVLSGLVSYAADTGSEEVKKLQWVKNADPISDAKKAIKNRNFALLGIAGYTWSIPGVDERKKLEYRDTYGLRILEGTSDVVFGDEHARLIDLAAEYAKKYNLYILSSPGRK
jgi:hypothetical protein